MGRAETDQWRQTAQLHLGAALMNVKRFDETSAVYRELLTMTKRLFGPNDFRTIECEERLASTMFFRVSRHESIPGPVRDEVEQRCLATLEHVYEWKAKHLGRGANDTLVAELLLSDVQRDLGLLAEAERHRQNIVEFRQRNHGLGPWDFRTLEAQFMLAEVLAFQNKIAEARALRDEHLPRCTRILGPHHDITYHWRQLSSDFHFDCLSG